LVNAGLFSRRTEGSRPRTGTHSALIRKKKSNEEKDRWSAQKTGVYVYSRRRVRTGKYRYERRMR